jgi:hypothetical protein
MYIDSSQTRWSLNTYLSDELTDHSIPASLNVRVLSPVVAILYDTQFICNTMR